MLLKWSFILIGIALVALMILIAIGRLIFRVFAPPTRLSSERRCACGYILKGLAMPRCPECGRAVGFDKSFEEMGISPDELRDIRKRDGV